ncbi:unnamed protein product [Rotaria sordida]|uniref:Prohibitin n=1 Tax=Rotaria sordida TaxID=392033 RepID=A0A815IR66_9BILA|nr:unnamed protein product [Rotaria sordida]
MGDTNGQVVAGGNGKGNRSDQLNYPTDVLIDKETDSLIICDQGNRRVVRWSRRSGTTRGEILIDNISSYGLAMDDQKYLYISDTDKNEVRQYQIGDKNGTLVAGGNGKGDGLNQLNVPTYIFVDQQQTVYVSDRSNPRVMKWNKGAKEGIVVAGGQGEANALTQLSAPGGLFVDTLGTIYVADSLNHRVMRWPKGVKQGTVIVGGNGEGAGANQFNYPWEEFSVLGRIDIGLGIGGGVINCMLYNVDDGHQDVIFDHFQSVKLDVIEEGTHFMISWLHRPIIFDIRTRPRSVPSITEIKDIKARREQSTSGER